MIEFVPTTEADMDRIRRWTDLDPYHSIQDPAWWLTGQGRLSFCVQDDLGPIVYARVDTGELYRLNCQFAPREVSKRRVAIALLQGLPGLLKYLRKMGAKGVIFASVSPSLVRFLKFQGFKEETGEYVLRFEEN